MTDAPNSFRERLAALKAEEAQKQATSPPEASTPNQPDFSEYADLVPEAPDDEISQERIELDNFMAKIDIVDAYARWCGKSKVNVHTTKREGIMISCPHPAHPDSNPSAWINRDKKVYFCGGCQEGGDKFDIAALHFGIDYKTDPAQFVELKKKMAGEYGYTVKQSLTGQIYLEKTKTWQEEPSPDIAPDVPTEPLAAQDTGVTSTPTPAIADSTPKTSSKSPELEGTGATSDVGSKKKSSVLPDFDLGGPRVPTLPWEDVTTTDTFLHVWMQEMSHDDLPEEYYWWLGLQAVGAAVGRAVSLEDSQPIFPNLLCCLIGDTGLGKSRSSGRLAKLLQAALPYDYNDPLTKGLKQVPRPGSGESLIKQFSLPLPHPANPKEIIGYLPVKGLVNFDEFSNLTSKSRSQGSTLQQSLMQLYDGYVDQMAISSLTHGVTQVEQPFTMGLATTQPRNIQYLVNNADKSSGFLNRWVFVTGAPKEPIQLQDHDFDLDPSIKKLQTIFAWAGKQHTVNFTSDGRTAYIKLFDEMFRPVKLGQDPTQGLLSRLDLTCKKIMLLLCANEMIEDIDERIVELVGRIIRYVHRTFLFVDGLVGNHEDANVQKAITEVINKHFARTNKPIKKRELFIPRLVNEFGSEKLVRVMRGMAELGFLEEMEVKPPRGPSWKGYILTSLQADPAQPPAPST